MPRIDIGIFTHANRTSLDKTRRDIKDTLDQMSRDASPDLLKGLDEKLPKVRQAFLGLADATDVWSRSTRALKENQEKHNEALEKAGRLQLALNDLNDKAGILNNEAAKQQRDLNEAIAAREPILKRQKQLEDEIAEAKAQHSKTTRTLADNAVTHTITGDDLAELKLRNAAEAESLRDLAREKAAFDKAATTANAEVAESERQLAGIRAEHTRTLKDLTDAQKEQDKQSQIAVDTARREADIHDSVAQSARRREEAIRRVTEAESDHNKRGGLFSGGDGGGIAGSAFRGILPGGARAGAGAYAIAAGPVGSLIEAAVTSSQALATLPAVAAAGAAGLLTLTIGFDGLGKAMKDVDDPKKFAKDLEKLGPAAQQVALEIQFLTQGPLKELKAATEQSLFNGVPEALHNLTNTLLPGIKQLTTGVGDAFNGMFKNFAGELTTPDSLKSINDIINNIVTAFHNLEPAVAPFVDALTKITQTGSSFLPGFANSIADAAKSFDDFITKAQQSGDLQKFMQEGIDAAKTLGGALWDLGGYIYQVFGHKEPGEFKQTLDDMVQSLLVVGNAIQGVAQVTNEFLKILKDIADLVGGYDNLFAIAFSVFAAGKFASILGNVRKLAGLLGASAEGEVGVAGALATLPAKAETAGAGIAAGLSKALPIVTAIMSAMALGDSPSNPANQGGVVKGQGMQAYLDSIQREADALTGVPNIPGGAGPGAQADRYGNRRPGQLGNFVDPGTANAPAPGPWGLAGLSPYHPFNVPSVADTETDSKKKAAALAGIDPNQFAVNPFEGLPASAIPPGSPGSLGGPGGTNSPPGTSYGPLQFGTNGKPFQKPGLGYQAFNDDAVLSRIDALNKDAQQLQVSQIELEGLKRSGVATQLELLKGEQKVTNDKASLAKDQRELLKDEAGHWEKVKQDKLKDLGPGLDGDMGLSRGLGGFFDNLIRFAGSMAMAPELASLQATMDADPTKGGYGMIGINGANNISNGLSPFLGRPYDTSSGNAIQGPFGTQFPVGSSPTASGAGFQALAGPGGPGTSPNGFQLNAPEQAFAVNGVSSQGAAGAPAQRLQQFAQWFNDNIEPVKELAGYDAGGHGLGNKSNHASGTALDINWSDFTALQGNGADARTHFSAEQTQAISQQLSAMGMTWGQYWTPGSRDPGHFELGGASYDKGAKNVDPTSGQPTSNGATIPIGASGLNAGPSYSGSATPVFVVNMPGGGGLGGIAPAGSPASGTGAGPAPGPALGGGGGTPLSAALAAAGFSPQQQRLIEGFSQVEGNNPAGNPTLGFKDSQLGGATDLQSHVNALVKQFQNRAPVAGQFPEGGTDAQQAQWIANVVGQNGSPGQPQDYVSRVMNALPGATSPPPVPLGDPRDLYTGGGGQGPIFQKPPAPAPGTPGTDLFGPGGILGGGPAIGQPPGPFAPLPGSPGSGSAPGQVGPFPVPQNVADAAPAPTLGRAAQLTPGTGPGGGGNGFAPQAPVGRASGEGGWQPSGAGAGADGGALGAAAGAAAGALDMIAPGAGQAAQTATKLINRSIQFGGQLAAIGVNGMIETFGLSGSAIGDPSKSWFGRLASGLAQAKPATPTSAGQTQAPLAPQQQQGQGGGPAVHIENFVQAENRNGQQAAQDLAHATASAPLKRP